MSQVQLTSLQSAVIRRLREKGYNAFADMASDAWSKGERLPLATTEVPDEPNNLLTDFVRANQQAGTADSE